MPQRRRSSAANRPGRNRAGSSRGGRNIPKLGSAAESKLQSANVRVPFRVRLTQAFPDAGSTVTTYNIDPSNLGDRITRISDEFLEYRILAMRLTALTDFATQFQTAGNDTNGLHAMSMSGPISTGTVSSVDDMVDAPEFQIGSLTTRTQLVVSPSFWSSRNFRWFYTRDQGDDELFVCARLTLATIFSTTAGANPTLNVIMEGVMELRVPIDGDINPTQLGFRGHTLPRFSKAVLRDTGAFAHGQDSLPGDSKETPKGDSRGQVRKMEPPRKTVLGATENRTEGRAFVAPLEEDPKEFPGDSGRSSNANSPTYADVVRVHPPKLGKNLPLGRSKGS